MKIPPVILDLFLSIPLYHTFFYPSNLRRRQCFPSISTICKETKLSRSTVKRAIRDLERAGFIDKEQRYRPNGGNSSNLYKLGK
ncbi:MAG: helix-turn-helix domain-containing protein [Monoglobaceae bacterium]